MRVAEMDAALRGIVDEQYARDEAAAKELLTAEEVAAIRANLEAVIQPTVWEWRVLHTLEALQFLVESQERTLTEMETENAALKKRLAMWGSRVRRG